MGTDEVERADLPTRVVHTLRDRGLTVATCESLTAGLVAATLAEVPGASAVLRGGLVTYATELKSTLAGVDAALLARVGAVDPEVAQQMAAGAARVCGADLGIACTGVAGPDPQDGKPVGLVYLGLARGATTHVREITLAGGREAIRRATAAQLLGMLEESLAAARPRISTRPGFR